MPELYLSKGTLKVTASGYWFTSGGEKGSFGYYPHLKDKSGLPLFPDTQLHGDLRMAATWLTTKLAPDFFNDSPIKDVFGSNPDGRRDLSSKLHITDLKLSNATENNKWTHGRYQIKPRIEINDTTRTVEEHMLVNIEMSYLEGLILEADIYLGYFKTEKDIKKAKELLEEAIKLLSGFGAFRSRGYGRGKIEIQWDEKDPTPVKYDEMEIDENRKSQFLYFLESQTNLRNRYIGSDRTQLIKTHHYIPKEQLRGWFVKTYNDLFGDWPKSEEMASVQFADLYPSVKDSDKPGYPPPMSTIMYENKAVEDMSAVDINGGIKKGSDNSVEKTKPKPLPPTMFVTDEPSVIPVETEKRMRNAMEDNFQTKESGLFAQEIVNRGAVFGGEIRIEPTKNDFAEKALFILSNEKLRPLINGCVFSQSKLATTIDVSKKNGMPLLVISPLQYSESCFNFSKIDDYTKRDNRITKEKANQIMLTTIKGYNTTLRRPRRNRIVIASGSVLYEDSQKTVTKVVSWNGFGKELRKAKGKPTSRRDSTPEKNREFGETIEKLKKKLEEISSSQVGQLRELLNPNIEEQYFKEFLEKRLEKYKNWKAEQINKNLIPEELINIILETLDNKGLVKAKEFISATLDEYYLYQWKSKKEAKAKTAFRQRAESKGYGIK